MVRKSEILKLLHEIWGPHFQTGDFAVWGGEELVAKTFTVHFQGNTGRAARLARKALGLQRQADGSWVEHKVVSTLGEAVKVFFNPDKSPKQRRVEAASKRLLAVLKENAPSDFNPNGLTVRRKEGIIQHQWQDLAKVVVDKRDDPTQLLFSQRFATLGYNKQGIIDKFSNYSLSGSSEGTVWCS
eukprot:425008-Karenia_brevis.AAC.1